MNCIIGLPLYLAMGLKPIAMKDSIIKQDIMLLPNYHAFYQKSNKVSETLQPCYIKVSFA